MKPIPLVLLAVTTSAALVFSQDEKTAVAGETLITPTTPYILGDLPDGTPPPPSPSKPAFIVLAKDILETETHPQGGRTITVQRINPIALPPPTEAPSIDLTDPAVQERFAKLRALRPRQTLLLAGATVYRSKDSPPRSLVQMWPQAEGAPLAVWSSADFALLSGLSDFTGSSGETSRLIMMWSITNLDRTSAFQAKYARQFQPPKIPDFPPGKATFIIASGIPTAETLASIQSLHDLYNNEHDRLATAYEGRMKAQLIQEAELKAHPPKPKDIVINYWRIDDSKPTPPTTSTEGTKP